jgi:hypothetical protein
MRRWDSSSRYLAVYLARLFLARVMVRRYRPRMIDDRDIWRAAQLLLKRHGEDAAVQAAQRADELLAEGDSEGCAIWKRILEAVGELSRTVPAEGERVN